MINIIPLLKRKPFVSLVLLPFFVFCLYQVLLASPRYESQAKLIVKEPDAASTLDPTMALLSGFGVSSSSSDTELVKAFIYSNDMLDHLQQTLNIKEHFANSDYDFISRLENDASKEEFFDYYLSRVAVSIDEKSQVVTVRAQAYSQEIAYSISQEIVNRAEYYINEIGHSLAKEQLGFVQKEHELVDLRLREAKSNLINFQRRHNLLDPQAEGMALQEITYRLEGEIAAKRTELRSLKSSMSVNAPLVIQAQAQLDSMVEQLENERARLTDESTINPELPPDEQNLSVSEILAKFSDYKIDMELALNAYTSSQISLEKSRIEAYRQLKFLVTVESPTLPQDAKYPQTIYNISLFIVLNLMLFGIGKIVLAILRELR